MLEQQRIGSGMLRILDKLAQEGIDIGEFSMFAAWMALLRRKYLKKPPYSFFNCALILLQRVGAIFVADEKEWECYFGRTIIPKRTPIVILQPFEPVKFVYEAQDTLGEKDLPDIFNTRFEVTGNSYVTERFFALVLERLNKGGIYYGQELLGTRSGGEIRLLDRSIAMNVPCRKDKDHPSGRKQIKTRYSLTVNASLSSYAKLMAIMHELGHLFCGHIPLDEENKKVRFLDRTCLGLSKEREEYEAEMACQLVCDTYQLEHDAEKYLADYPLDEEEKREAMPTIIDAADRIAKIIFAGELYMS